MGGATSYSLSDGIVRGQLAAARWNNIIRWTRGLRPRGSNDGGERGNSYRVLIFRRVRHPMR